MWVGEWLKNFHPFNFQKQDYFFDQNMSETNIDRKQYTPLKHGVKIISKVVQVFYFNPKTATISSWLYMKVIFVKGKSFNFYSRE